jgi:hypothetical protein
MAFNAIAGSLPVNGVMRAPLVRDAKRVAAALRKLDDKQVVCVKPTKIYIPARFAEVGLAVVGTKTQIIGICAIVVDDAVYSVMMANALVGIDPTSVNTVMIDDTEYYEFSFDAGATVFTSTEIVQMDSLAYAIYNEIIAGGRVPAYLSYVDLGHIFDTAGPYAGANIGRNREVTELICSLIARDSERRELYYRQTVQTLNASATGPVFIPLRSVQYSATNTTNRIVGSYMREGLNAALVMPSERQERIEKLLMS